jgi:hypothetical protein
MNQNQFTRVVTERFHNFWKVRQLYDSTHDMYWRNEDYLLS